MNIKTALVAWNCRLRERAGMIQNCKRHPEDMSVKQWSDAHSITVANYYYRMKEVRKPLLIRSVELLSRDLLCYAMQNLSDQHICGHVHDELIIECPEGTDVSSITSIMGKSPVYDTLKLPEKSVKNP